MGIVRWNFECEEELSTLKRRQCDMNTRFSQTLEESLEEVYVAYAMVTAPDESKTTEPHLVESLIRSDRYAEVQEIVFICNARNYELPECLTHPS